YIGVSIVYCFFFFQAEDGIRDYKVTGVQTCALPISIGRGSPLASASLRNCSKANRTISDRLRLVCRETLSSLAARVAGIRRVNCRSMFASHLVAIQCNALQCNLSSPLSTQQAHKGSE